MNRFKEERIRRKERESIRAQFLRKDYEERGCPASKVNRFTIRSIKMQNEKLGTAVKALSMVMAHYEDLPRDIKNEIAKFNKLTDLGIKMKKDFDRKNKPVPKETK